MNEVAHVFATNRLLLAAAITTALTIALLAVACCPMRRRVNVMNVLLLTCVLAVTSAILAQAARLAH